jgi:hypothetical protein
MREFGIFRLALPTAESAMTGPASLLAGHRIDADIPFADDASGSKESVVATTTTKRVAFVLGPRFQPGITMRIAATIARIGGGMVEHGGGSFRVKDCAACRKFRAVL